MRRKIDDQTIERVSVLAQLELDAQERVKAKKDMEQMLEYMDLLGEPDCSAVEPMTHLFPLHNVFREDEISPCTDSGNILSNAPRQRGGMFQVPRTYEE